ERRQKRLWVDGLFQDRARAQGQGLAREREVLRSGHDHDANGGVEGLDPLESLEAAQSWHEEVEDDARRSHALDLDQRIEPVRRAGDAPSVALETGRVELAEI